MTNSRSRSISSRRLFTALRLALCAAAFFALANAMRAEDRLSYDFETAAKSAGLERGVGVSLDVSSRDEGGYTASYSHREWVRETLTDVKAVTFERYRILTAAEGAAFFASLVDAGLWKLPKGDNFIGDAPNTRINATISGRDLERIYNSPINSAARKSFHAAVIALAKKLGIDQPEDVARVTRMVEGDRTPAREIPFSALITNPARYDGKRIAVAGFYHTEFECSLLVSERFDWHTLDSDRKFWIGGSSKFAKPSNFHWKNDSWVRLEGVFSASHGGHMGASPGVIRRVTKLTALDEPPRPPAADALNEDDPHGLEKLTLEIEIQPFPMDGRPIQEVVAALNKQIAAQLAERGLAEDWLKIELDSTSNPKARVDQHAHPDKAEPLRRIIQMLGARASPGENAPFGGYVDTYTYILPNLIRLHMMTSRYPDDEDPFSYHAGTFGKQPVRAKFVRYVGKFGGPETFLVEWHCDLQPEALRVSEALALIRKILPDEPGAKSISSLDILRDGTAWQWAASTDASPPTATSIAGLMRIEPAPDSFYLSPMSTFAGRHFHAQLDFKTVHSTPEWNFTGEPPLQLDAAIRAAGETLKGIPNAEASLQMQQIRLVPLGATHCAYLITFRDPANRESFLVIPVLLSGQAIAPKPYPDPTGKK